MNKGLIRKVIKFSSVDGIGNRSAIFFQGCNFNCKYCHNPETIDKGDNTAKLMSVYDIFDEIGSAVNYIRGITASGGECTLQLEFLKELFIEAKSKGLSTFIDTNGSIDLSHFSELMDVTDGVMLDIKSVDESEHKMITGMSNKIVLKNLEMLAANKKLHEVRTVISKKMAHYEKTVNYVAEVLEKYGGGKYKLIKYRPMGVRKQFISDFSVPNDALMAHLSEVALSNGVNEIVVV